MDTDPHGITVEFYQFIYLFLSDSVYLEPCGVMKSFVGYLCLSFRCCGRSSLMSHVHFIGLFICLFQALWTLEPRDITEDQHEEFYRFISNTFDKPRYFLHYKTDAPLNIRALFYIPDYKPSEILASQYFQIATWAYHS